MCTLRYRITYVLFCAQVIYTQGFILAFMINAFLRKIFFGTLRAAELEVSEPLLSPRFSIVDYS